MKKVLKSFVEIARELLILAYIFVVFLAFIFPVWTSFGGKYSKTVFTETTAIESRDALAFYQLENEGTFIWKP